MVESIDVLKIGDYVTFKINKNEPKYDFSFLSAEGILLTDIVLSERIESFDDAITDISATKIRKELGLK
jgi:hypothetical protein